MASIHNFETSPYWKALGMKIASASDDVVELVVSPHLKQYFGKVHGGVLASMIDAAIASAIHSQLNPEQYAVTVELKINYLRPVVQGKLLARGQVIHMGKNLAVGQASVVDDEDRVVAVGTATFMIQTDQ